MERLINANLFENGGGGRSSRKAIDYKRRSGGRRSFRPNCGLNWLSPGEPRALTALRVDEKPTPTCSPSCNLAEKTAARHSPLMSMPCGTTRHRAVFKEILHDETFHMIIRWRN